MIYGFARLGGRTIWLLLVAGGLLIWAGRSDAALLGPAGVAPPLESAPRLDRIDDGDVEAHLAISGQMLVLRLRGGDLAALAKQLDSGSRPEIAIRVDGQELLAAELLELRVEGDRLESRPPQPPRLELESPVLIAAAIGTGETAPPDVSANDDGTAGAEEEEGVARLAGAGSTTLPVPEPGAAALLATGLLGLGLAGRRSRRAVQTPAGRGMA